MNQDTKQIPHCELPHFHKENIDSAMLTLPDDKTIDTLAQTFKVLSDMSRLKIVLALMNNELCVCDICHVVSMSQSAISHQLRVLRAANLVKYRKNGKLVYYSIDDEHVSTMVKLASEHTQHTHKNEEE